MDKQQADLIIKGYLKPLYGFALNKTGRQKGISTILLIHRN